MSDQLSGLTTGTMSNGAASSFMEATQSAPPELKKPASLSPAQQKELISDLEQKFQMCANARINFDRQWYYNLSMYFGKQWAEWVGGNTLANARLYEPPAPNWRVRLVINKIRRVIRTELTKLTKEEMQYYVLPQTGDDEDIAAARGAEGAAEFLFRETHFNAVRRSATFWALLCGSAFMKTYYDPFNEDSTHTPGKICLDPVNAFHLYVPSLQEEQIEGQPFICHASARDPDMIANIYGEEVTADVSVGGSTLEQRYLNAMGVGQFGTSKLVYVKEFWIKPCKKHPEGALVTIANQKLLAYVPQWPYEFNWYPFAKIDHIPTGRFYGDSVIVDLTPLQKDLNRSRSQLVESRNRMAKPQLISPKGAVNPNRITSEPGLIIEYTPGFNPPQPLPLSNIPSYVIEELDRTENDIDDLASQSEVTRGTAPPGIEAASAISFLSEQNDTRLYHTVASIEDAVEKTGKTMLELVQQFWDAERLVRIMGKDSTIEAYMFSNATLQGNTDFYVEAGSAAPRSRAAKQAFITELGKLGWITPDRALKYMEMVETNKLYSESQIDSRQVQRENMRMSATATPLPINTYDNNDAHIEYHEKFMKSEQYETLDPQIQQVLLQHLDLHKQQQMATLQQQMIQGAQPNVDAGGAQPGAIPSGPAGQQPESQ